MARGYGGRRRLRMPDAGELIGIVVLAVIAIWGIWFGIQSLITLWWPINLAYLIAGALVASISTAVAVALLNR